MSDIDTAGAMAAVYFANYPNNPIFGSEERGVGRLLRGLGVVFPNLHYSKLARVVVSAAKAENTKREEATGW